MNAIEVRNLHKIYRIYQFPGHRLKEIILRRPFHSVFVALEDIDFSVGKGESFGIIGENGAGKSTLMKILAKTLKPSSGSLEVQGRTAALLELGAGFNPELTGEENIYMNAFLLGLSKPEIDEKRQEIIDFSELGDFIKRPIKTYSSGMYVRLAFSIATSVNPDILIIDEALSVGDEYFQKKCVDRMMNFRKEGKTIIFCSHSMYYVQELCQRALWIHNGKAKAIGASDMVIMEYQNHERYKTAALAKKSETAASPDVVCEKPVRIGQIKILNSQKKETELLKTGEEAFFSFTVSCSDNETKGHIGFAVVRNDELTCFGTTTMFDGISPVVFRDGREFIIRMQSLSLLSGIYSVLIIVADEFAMHPYDTLRSESFTVTSGRREFGMSYLEHEWIV